jgi:hypothetical protein
MKMKLLFFGEAIFATSVLLAPVIFAGTEPYTTSKEAAPPTITESEPWQFTIAAPGWMPGMDGTVGLRGVNADVGIDFGDIFRHLDMIFAMRAEADKGPFGVYGELIYMSLSDSAEVNGLVQKVDVRVDQYLADGGLSWRFINQPRWSLDLTTGSHYTNLYERLTLQGDTVAIDEASVRFVDNISAALRNRLNQAISNSDFVTRLKNKIRTDITNGIDNSLGGEQRKPTVPIAPLGGRLREDIAQRVEHFIQLKKAELRARVDALVARGVARRAAVDRVVSAAKGRIANQLAFHLDKKLNQTLSRGDYWFDPYVGLRGRYNFNKVFYTAARGEIGGFDVGSDLMWEVEGVIGINLTRSIFTEIGYRALSVDYNNDGLLFDTITHGPQITTGITF